MTVSYNSPMFTAPSSRGMVNEFASMTEEVTHRKRREAFGANLNRSLKLRAKGVSRVYDADSAPLLERNHVAIRDNYLLITTIGIGGSPDIYGYRCVSSDGQIDLMAISHSYGNPLFLGELVEGVERYWKSLNPELIGEDGSLYIYSSKFNFGQIFLPSANGLVSLLNAVGTMTSNPNLYGLDTRAKKVVAKCLFAILSLSSSSPFFSHCVSVSDLISRLYILSDLQIEDGGVSTTHYYSLSYLAKNIYNADIASEVLSVSRESHLGGWYDQSIEEMELNALGEKYDSSLHPHLYAKDNYEISVLGGRSDDTRGNIYRTLRYVEDLSIYLIGQIAKMDVTEVARLSIYRYESSMIRRELDRIESGSVYAEAVSVKMLSDYLDNMESYLIANEPFYREVGIAANEVIYGAVAVSEGGEVYLTYEGDSKIRIGDRLNLMKADSAEIIGSLEIEEVGNSWLKLSISGTVKSQISSGDCFYLIPSVSTWSDMSYMLRTVYNPLGGDVANDDATARDAVIAEAGTSSSSSSSSLSLEEDVFEKLERNDVVLVNSPPGGGKTTLLIRIAELAIRSDKSIIIATATVAQGLEIASRLSARSIPATFITRANASDSSYPKLDGVTYESKIAQALVGEVVIATVAKLQLSKSAKADLLLVDEAYQSTYGDIYIIHEIGDKVVLVGDPGQLDPVVSIDTTKMNILKNPIVYSAPYGFNVGEDATCRIDASYRLPQSTVDVIGPVFYPELKFESKQVDGMTFELVGLEEPKDERDRDSHLLLSEVGKDRSIIFSKNFFDDVAKEDVANRINEAVSFISYLVNGNHHYIDKRDGDEGESRIVRRIEASDIAVITPGRKTVGQIKSLLAKEGLADVEVETVERWQGKEKLISVVFILPDELATGPSASSPKRQSVMYSRHQLAVFTFGATLDNFFFPPSAVK